MLHLLAGLSRQRRLQVTACLASLAALTSSAPGLAGLRPSRASRGPMPRQSRRDARGHRLAGSSMAMLATTIAAAGMVAETAEAQPVGPTRARVCHLRRGEAP